MSGRALDGDFVLIRQRKVRIEIEQTGSGPSLFRREHVQIEEQRPAWPRPRLAWLMPSRLALLLQQRLRRKSTPETLAARQPSRVLDLPAAEKATSPKGDPRA